MPKIDNVRDKLMLDYHHKMERFCAIFLAFLVALMSIFFVCLKIHNDNQKLSLDTIALYTTSSEFSLSGDTVKFLNLYRSDDFSKIFILARIGDGNMSRISTNANDYQMYMTGAEGTKITGSPVGSIYMFGNTGYMGLYFFDSDGFKPAVYDIVLRNTSMITDVDTTNASDSYSMFNQCHLTANFAGRKGVVADFLNSENPTLEDMYEELMFSNNLQTYKDKAANILKQINSQMALVNEYRNRLINDQHIQVPALPAALAGDRVTTDVEETRDNPLMFDKSMLSSVDSIISTNYFTTVNLGTDDESSAGSSTDLYLVTDYVFPGGYQYNYQDIGIKANMIARYMPADAVYDTWIASKENEIDSYSDSVSLKFGDWYDENNQIVATYKEGYLASNGSSWDVKNNNMMIAINDYTSAVTQLYTLKKNYQQNILPKIFASEMEKSSVSSIFSINSSDDTLLLY